MRTGPEPITMPRIRISPLNWAILAIALAFTHIAQAQDVRIAKADAQIDGLDPGIKLFVRDKMAEGNTSFTDQNIVLFLHGATAPSTCDFDLSYKDYSWADWMVKRGYVVYLGDYRNYGFSTREPAMDEPAGKNQPVTRSYLALRDITVMVNHIKGEARREEGDPDWLVMGRHDSRLLCLAAQPRRPQACAVRAAL